MLQDEAWARGSRSGSAGGVQAEGSLNVGTCVAVVRVKEGSRNARQERDWGERKFTGRTIPGVGVISFSTGEARGQVFGSSTRAFGREKLRFCVLRD